MCALHIWATVLNGQNPNLKNHYNCGGSVKFTCKNNYSLSGKSEIFCEETKRLELASTKMLGSKLTLE